jgi:ligand-binding sensor domain-containing protein
MEKRIALTIIAQTVALVFVSCASQSAVTRTSTNGAQKTSMIAGRRISGMVIEKSCGSDLRQADSILQDATGSYWLGGIFGLVRFEADSNQCLHIRLDEGFAPRLIAQSSDGKLWVLASSIFGPNVVSFDPGTKVPGPQPRRSMLPDEMFSVSAVFAGKEGRLWFAVGGRLVAYANGLFQKPLEVEVSGSSGLARISFGLEDSDGNLWVGWGSTVYSYQLRTRKWTNLLGSSSNMAVNGAYEDSRKRIWFWRPSGTVSQYDMRTENLTSYDLTRELGLAGGVRPGGGVSNPRLLSSGVVEDKGELIFATRSGLVTFSETGGWNVVTSQNSALPSDVVTAIAKDRVGKMWLGTASGLVVLEP